jgi:pimeloyl-ACP methyl ester carboxylesterase
MPRSTASACPAVFEIAVSDAVLADLRARLRATRWPETFREPAWDAGLPTAFMRRVLDYWADEFDRRSHERRINTRPQFKVAIDGGVVHYSHVRGLGPTPLPLVLTHGWPSSFAEFDRVTDLLADPGAHGADPADAFDVVIPSLPGYPFSAPLTTPGALRGIPRRWHRLMSEVLGYSRYGAHGGDIGALVTAALGREHPESVIGIHILSLLAAVDADDPSLTAGERTFLLERRAWAEREGGYSHQQQTRPQTLASD